MNLKVKSTIKNGFIISAISFVLAFLLSAVVGEYIVKHIFPQNTYSLAKLVGLHIFEEGENVPITLKKNVKDFHHISYTREFDHFVSTNSHGIRGEEFNIQKNANTYRILLLGDSMTFGWGVQGNETYAALLEENLNNWAKATPIDTRFEVINAGFTDGKSLGSYYVYLKDIGLNFNPDLVVLDFFPYNDISDISETNWDQKDTEGYPLKITSNTEKVENGYLVKKEKTNWMFEIPILRNSHLAILLFNALEKGSPNLVLKIRKILNVTEVKQDKIPNRILNCIQALNETACPPKFLENYEKSKLLIKGMKKLSKESNKQFMTTLMAETQQAVPIGKEEDVKEKIAKQLPQKDIKEFLENESIDYYDFLDVLARPDSEKFFYKIDGHLTKSGHQRASRGLSEFIAGKYFPGIKISPE